MKRFALTAVVVSAALFAMHPVQRTFWFDVGLRVEDASRLPLSRTGVVEVIRLQAREHSPNYVRPVRAIQWLVLSKLLGRDPRSFYAANVVSLAVAISALMEVARRLGANPWIVGLCFAVSYASVLPLIFIGFGFTLAFGFLGLLAYFSGHAWLCLGLLLTASLSHETMLALSLIPLAHAIIESTSRGRAYVVTGTIPLYLGYRVIHTAVFGSVPLWTSWSESVVRVTFTFMSGGLALETVRGSPWLPPFLRVRDLFSMPAGIGALLAVCAPAIAMTALAWRRAPRRRVLLCGAWAAFAVLPLLLPVTTPEAYHLSIGLTALFVLWASQPASRTFLAALAAWVLIHGWVRERLFYHDLPIIATAVRKLEPLKGDPLTVMVNVPIQVGPHYAMLPDLGFRGCFVDPLWIWTSGPDGGIEAQKQAGRRIVEDGASFVRLCP